MQIRVLQLLSSTGLYGAENVVIELAKELDLRGIKVFLGILENNSNAHFAIASEAKKYIQDICIFPCNGKLDIKTILHLKNFLESNNINIIHSHKYKTNFYSLLLKIFKKIPLVATCHNWLSENYKMRLYEWLDKRILVKFDKVIAVSDEIKNQVLMSGLDPSRALKIKNGISMEKYAEQYDRDKIRAEFGIDSNRVLIGSVGRLDRNKGITYLLRAAKPIIKEFGNISILIVGDGPSKTELYDEAKELGIEKNVILVEFRTDIPSILSALDIFVLPSLKEGLPMVLLEAMASKKPVIASRVGDIPTVITNNKSGLLVNPADVNQLENSIRRLIKDKGLSNLLAEQAFKVVNDEYSSRNMTSQYIEVYREVLHI